MCNITRSRVKIVLQTKDSACNDCVTDRVFSPVGPFGIIKGPEIAFYRGLLQRAPNPPELRKRAEYCFESLVLEERTH